MEPADGPVQVICPVVVNRQECQVPEDPEDDLERGNQDDCPDTFLLNRSKLFFIFTLILCFLRSLAGKFFRSFFLLKRLLSGVYTLCPDSHSKPYASCQHDDCRHTEARPESEYIAMRKDMFIQDSCNKRADKRTDVNERISY